MAAVVMYARSSVAWPVYQEEHYEGQHEHHGLPPATSYATISTTHVKVQHPPAAPSKYATPYKVSGEKSKQKDQITKLKLADHNIMIYIVIIHTSSCASRSMSQQSFNIIIIFIAPLL